MSSANQFINFGKFRGYTFLEASQTKGFRYYLNYFKKNIDTIKSDNVFELIIFADPNFKHSKIDEYIESKMSNFIWSTKNDSISFQSRIERGNDEVKHLRNKIHGCIHQDKKTYEVHIRCNTCENWNGYCGDSDCGAYYNRTYCNDCGEYL